MLSDGDRFYIWRSHSRMKPPWAKGGRSSQKQLVAAFVGLSIKIHAVVDALGNPLSFHLTPGQASDLEGADQLLGNVIADTVLADKAYDADERVIERLQAQGKTVVIPPRRNRKQPRDYDKELYKARHLIENFFAFLKQYPAIATRYDRRAINFLGAIYLAASVKWLNR